MRRRQLLGSIGVRVCVAVLSLGAATLAAGIPSATAGTFTSTASLWKVATVQPLPSGESTAGPLYPYSVLASIEYDTMFHGVSCVNSSFCVTVGSETPNPASPKNNNSGQAVIETYDGFQWSLTPVPQQLSRYYYSELDGVSCVSTTFCMAVGTLGATSSSTTVTLAEVYNGSSWSVVPSPDVSGIFSYLSGVSCVSTTFCVAVGWSGGPDNSEPLIEEYNGAAWSMMTSPVMPANNENVLFSVSCVSTTFCAAVGRQIPTNGTETLMETYNGHGWSLTPSPAAAFWAYSVSCVSTTFCVAAGFQWISSAGQSATPTAAIEIYKGCSWELASIPQSLPPVSFLYGVSCATSTSCVADGNIRGAGGFAATFNGSSWSFASLPQPFYSTYPDFTSAGTTTGVSCPSASFCVLTGITGGTGSNSNDDEPFAMQASGNVTGSPVVAPPGGTGYYETATDGGIFSFGAAHFYGSMGSEHLNAPIVAMATTFHGLGYWLGAADGGVFAFGNANFYGSMGGKHLNQPVVGMSPTSGQAGYWLVASDGGIFSFGDAVFHGSMGGKPLTAPVEAMATDYCTGGYWLVASDGGIFSFYAPFYGSMGGKHLNAPIVAMAPTPDGKGYWLVAADGGIFSFGNAHFHGSMGGRHLNAPIVGIATTPRGNGYWLVAKDGGVFAFGDARFFGSMGTRHLDAPVFSMAATP